MADNSIDVSFSQQFEADVHLAYQRMGAKLPNTVRRKNNVSGKQTTFQVLAKGEAQGKARNSDVPILNLTHTAVPCVLEDAYAGELVDRLDELKTEHDERQVVATSIAAAMGRKSDAILVAAADAGTWTSRQTADASGEMTEAKVQDAYEYLGDNDVPEDGQRCLSMTHRGWGNLMVDVASFADRDYVPESEMPFRGGAVSAKRWWTFMAFAYTGWTKDGSNIVTSYAWHKQAFGFASQAEVSLDITWQGMKAAHLVVGSLAQGACIIDQDGAWQMRTTEA